MDLIKKCILIFIAISNITLLSQNVDCKINQYDENNRKDGKWVYIDDNGNIEKIINYTNGLINGDYISFFYNLTIKSKLFFLNGIKIDSNFYYYKNGNIKSEFFIINDKTKYHKKYSEDGKEWIIFQYNDIGELLKEIHYDGNDTIFLIPYSNKN
jgi:antitoxin component YwqK of YwqJK toxin-antitoxin module